MKNLILITLLLLLSAGPMQAHEGHGDTKPKTTTAEGGFKSEAVSDKYEYVVKYAHADAGEEATYTLYINEFNTNRPVKGGTVKLDLGGSAVAAESTQPGIYVFNAAATTGPKNLKVSLEAEPGADLVLLKGIDPTRQIQVEEIPVTETVLPAWAWALIGGLLGAALIFVVMRFAGRKAKVAMGLALFLLPLSQPLNLSAHEGHGDASKKTTSLSADGRFVIAKESQFLFGLLTQRVTQGEYAPSIKAFGTITPSPQGQAEIISPQAGRLATINAKVGDHVRKGQILASVEQVIDAQTRAQLEAERNTVTAELTAAKADFDRLQTIADIAAKRDLTEARARYEKAVQNKRVFDRTVSGSGRTTPLASPIDGVLQGFSFAIGANVSAGQTLFTVTNLAQVFVEAQVFDKDLPAFAKAGRFTITCADPARKHVSSEVQLVNIGQTLNPTNQSQRVTFQVLNADEDFKIGEFVDIRAFSKPQPGVITVPTSAITEVDGKQVVFIKDAPEAFSASFIELGESNGEVSVVLKGVEAGERVAATAAYQAKMIYENQ